jgi:tRNA threonylcarbamoyladenosine biosynthesis protein TsaB
MLILGLETSTRMTSVALVSDGEVLSFLEEEIQNHEENLLPLVDRTLKQAGRSLADIETVAIGCGPGSFTGLRIGFATAKGLCFAASVPLRLVSSLAALALDHAADSTVRSDHLLVPLLDARRSELFVGAFQKNGNTVIEVAEPSVQAPADVSAYVATLQTRAGCERAIAFGDGVLAYPGVAERLDHILTTRMTPSAASVGRLAATVEVVELAGAEPTYIRPSAAEVRFPDGNPGGSFSPE